MNAGAQEPAVRKENQVLLATRGTKDRLAHRVLKETQDQLGLPVPKGIRVSKDNQVSQDHQVHQVFLEKLEGMALLGLKVKKAMMVLQAPRDQLDPQAHQAHQG